MKMKKLPLVLTAVFAAAALASCRGGKEKSQSSNSGEQPEGEWSESSQKAFEDWLLFDLPYFSGAEAEGEAGIVVAKGDKATSKDVDSYCEKIEEYYEGEWEEEEDGTTYKLRNNIVSAEYVSGDAEYYFGLDSAAEYRIVVEYYDEEYKEWAPTFYYDQVIHFGLDPESSEFTVYSVLGYNIYNAVFGIDGSGMSLYTKDLYPLFDVNDESENININTFAQAIFATSETASNFDGKFLTPEFSAEGDDVCVAVADYQYLFPFLYGNIEDPIFSTELDLCGGTESEHDGFITTLTAAGWTEVDDEERVEEGERLFEKATAKGVCETSLSEYSDEFVELTGGEYLSGYGVTFTFLLSE